MDKALKAWNIKTSRALSGDIQHDPMFRDAYDKLQNDILMIGGRFPKNSIEKSFSGMLYHSLFISEDGDHVEGTVRLLRESVDAGRSFKSMADEFMTAYNRPKMKMVKKECENEK